VRRFDKLCQLSEPRGQHFTSTSEQRLKGSGIWQKISSKETGTSFFLAITNLSGQNHYAVQKTAGMRALGGGCFGHRKRKRLGPSVSVLPFGQAQLRAID
jgi:hypothetical protein